MNMPKLRFKEFNANWAVKTLGELFNIVVGFVGTISDSYCEERDGILFIRTLNVREGRFSLSEIQYVTTEFHERNKKSQIYNNDILIARVGANMGMVCKVAGLENEANSANVIIIKSNSTNNSDFYSLYLNSPKGQKQIQAKGAGGAQEVLNISVAKTIIVPVPSLPEQTKIANFLTAIDEKITQLTQKYDLLKQYKKGVMQQIFSQKLRFKDDDGREFAEWEETTLENIATFLRGGSLSKSNISVDGMFECIHYGELFTIYSEVIKTVKSRTNLTDAVRSISGDILMPSSDVTPSGLAKASCILETGIILGGDINIIRVTDKINSIFISYLLNFEKNKIIQLVSGTTVKHIYIKDIKTISLTIPQNKKEQTKIANFLTAIDDKITQTQTQLEAVKQYKKGLLQQMFV